MQTARMAGVRAPGASLDQLSAARRMSVIRWAACASGVGRRGDSDMLDRETGLAAKGKTSPVLPWSPSHSRRVGAAVALLPPRVAPHVVPVLLPESGIILLEELEP